MTIMTINGEVMLSVFINGSKTPSKVKDIKAGDIFKLEVQSIDCTALLDAYLYYDKVSWIVDFTNENLPEGYVQSVIATGNNMLVSIPMLYRKPVPIDENRMNQYVSAIKSDAEKDRLEADRQLVEIQKITAELLLKTQQNILGRF